MPMMTPINMTDDLTISCLRLSPADSSMQQGICESFGLVFTTPVPSGLVRKLLSQKTDFETVFRIRSDRRHAMSAVGVRMRWRHPNRKVSLNLTEYR